MVNLLIPGIISVINGTDPNTFTPDESDTIVPAGFTADIYPVYAVVSVSPVTVTVPFDASYRIPFR